VRTKVQGQPECKQKPYLENNSNKRNGSKPHMVEYEALSSNPRAVKKKKKERRKKKKRNRAVYWNEMAGILLESSKDSAMETNSGTT
jgi:hypothetical protein